MRDMKWGWLVVGVAGSGNLSRELMVGVGTHDKKRKNQNDDGIYNRRKIN